CERLTDTTSMAFAVAAALAWIVAVPRSDDARPWGAFARVFVAELAVLQLLHVYPVASEQQAPGALMLVVAGGICVADGLAGLRRESAEVRCAVRGVGIAAFAALVVWAAPPLRGA